MILTCPECKTRFLVAEGAIGPRGRRVRCANCGHVWKQDPEIGLDDELFEEPSLEPFEDMLDEDDPFENPVDNFGTNENDHVLDNDFQSILQKEIESSPIPEGVRPSMDDPALAQLGQGKKSTIPKIKSPASLGGYAASAFVFLLLMSLVFALQPTISRVLPATNSFYGLFNLKPALPGEGLTMEDLSAQIQGDKIFLAGRIINLKSSDLKIPTIIAKFVNDEGKVMEQVSIAPPSEMIKAEEVLPFEHVLAKRPDGATNVTFAFSF